MILSRKKMVAMVLSVILFGGLCFTIGMVYSNGGTPTIDPTAGMSGFPWFNASTGVYAPEFWHVDRGNYTAWVLSVTGEGGVTDHGALTGLSDDDHALYLLQSGAEGLTGNWDVGNYDLTAKYMTADEFYHSVLGNYTAWVEGLEGGGVTDHGALTGLADDDHPQYQTGEYTSTGLADHAYSGTTITGTAGEALAIGDLVFLDSDGKYWECDANLSSKMFCVALSLGSISADSTGLLLLDGYLRDDTWSGWTVGSESPLFVSWTPGLMTQTLPSETGDQVQIIGYPIASKIVRFDPDSTVVEIG